MLRETKHFYTPETVALMTAAFDEACQSLPGAIKGNDDVRRQLALIIFRHVDRGEQDPILLSEIACREVAGLNGSAQR